MKFRYSAALFVAAAVISTGCGERDREEAKKTKDGLDTFVYLKPDLKKHAERTTTKEMSERATGGNASPTTSSEHASTPPADEAKPE